MKHPLSALTLLIGGALLSNTALATQSWFEVELILFERLGEKSSEQFVSAIKQYNLENALTVQDDFVFGTLQDCPPLSQFERFSLLPKDNIVDDVDNSALMVDDLTTNDNVLTTFHEQCIALDDQTLQQAFVIQAQRLSDKRREVTASKTELSPINALVLNELPLSTDTLDETIAFDPTVFIPYPNTFSFNGKQYQSVPKPAAIKKLPLTIKQALVTSTAVSLNDNGLQTQIPESLIHNPNAPYLLDDAHLEMTQLAKKFRWQKSTKPLLHIGWRQPMLARHLAKPIHLFAGKDFSDDFDVLGNDKHALVQSMNVGEEVQTALVMSEAVNDENTQEASFAPSVSISDIVAQLTSDNEVLTPSPIWQLDGLLKIYLNRFLFIESDFDLRKVEQVKVDKEVEYNALTLVEEGHVQAVSLIKHAEKTSAANNDVSDQYVTKLTSHPMKQHRKVRSKEIHYFDHPTMGMVIQIRRFKIPEVVQVPVKAANP